MTTARDTRLLATTLRLITEYGQTVTLDTAAVATGATYDPTTGKSTAAAGTTQSVKMRLGQVEEKWVQNGLATDATMQGLLSGSGLNVTPQRNLIVTHGSDSFTVTEVAKVYGNDDVVLWVLFMKERTA